MTEDANTNIEDVRSAISYHDESQAERLARKSKESPFMIIGLGGLLAAVGVGVYQFKHKGAMSTSVFLMQFRVIAQGTVVGALTAGIAYSLYSNYTNKKPIQNNGQ